MSEQIYDVLVIGGGTAGTAAAKAAHAAGARTAMFNAGELGGLCILRGCMPTKTMLHAAHLAHQAHHHGTPGVHIGPVELDFAAIMANKDAKVARFQRAKIAGIEQAGYEVIDAKARFCGPDRVIAGGKTYRFEKGAVIATGSVSHVLPIAGIEEVDPWTSDDVMRQTERPDSLIVLGVGAIGLELAQFFARMGTRVSLASRRKALSDVDPVIADEMEKVLEDEPNLRRICPFRPESVRADGASLRLQGEGEAGELAAERLLLATGRRADCDGLGLEEAGVALDHGRITHGDDMRSSNPKIFVCGDATGRELLLHVANQEGVVAGLGAAGVPGTHEVDRRLRMAVVFTDPPAAWLGMNEAEARTRGLEVVTALEFFAETGRAITMDVRHGVWKLIADAQTGEILGTQILGPRADDLVHILAATMQHRGTVENLLATPMYHPTLSEVIWSLARSLQAKIG